MPINSSELLKLQQTELQILQQFDIYCKANSLQYYLIGGALLGAVRDQKWIAWDDDIDVAMPREDYERLQTLYRENQIPGLFLQSAETDPMFSRAILKLRLDGSELIEKSTANVQMHQGIYIDIFPIDYVDSEKISCRAKRIRCLMSLRCIRSGCYTGKYHLIKKAIRYGVCFLPLSVIDRRITKLCTKENNGSKKYSILFLHNYDWTKQFHESEVFGQGSECVFEGHIFQAPAEQDRFLRRVFGDDYLCPPAEKKHPHNYLSVTFPEEKRKDENR